VDDKEVLLELWKGTGARVVERRSYEWKIAFGLWAAQLTTLSVLLLNSNKLDLDRDWFWAMYLGAGLMLTGLHAIYVLKFIRYGNHRDSTLARAYEADLHSALGDAISASTKTTFKRTPQASDPATPPYTAANWFAIGVTGFLSVVAPVAVAAL
jgi:hypothetical protein